MCSEEYIPLRLAELLKKRGYSRYQLSKLTGISQTALGNILTKDSIPTVPTLERICEAFGITLAQFFIEDEERPDLTDEQKEIVDIWDGLEAKEQEIFLSFARSLKK